MEGVYEYILDHYGEENQTNKCIEELSELITALIHFRTKKHYGYVRLREDVVCEIADVEIMLEQIKIALEIKPVELQEVKRRQLNRVLGMIKEEREKEDGDRRNAR